jgi:uncharacterized LabA/DUF88 family protein
MERVIAYIDGYNLYFGLKEGGYSRYKWLNVQELVSNLLNANQTLITVNYFTTIVTNDSAVRLRQKAYISALQTLDKTELFYGKFQKEKNNCRVCGNNYMGDSEKMTDVAISTELMKDYYTDKFDMAMIISGDTDLLPPIKFINGEPNGKRVFVAFPPNRQNDEVKEYSKGSMIIGRANLAKSQFPSLILDKYGAEIKMPNEWA